MDLYGVPGLFERDNVLVILPNIFVFDVIRTTSKMFYLFHLLSNHIKFKTFKANSFPFERFKRCHGFFLHKYSPQNYRNEKTRKYFMYIKVVTIHCVYTHSYKYNVVKVKVTAFQVIRMQIIINFSKHMHIFFYEKLDNLKTRKRLNIYYYEFKLINREGRGGVQPPVYLWFVWTCK